MATRLEHHCEISLATIKAAEKALKTRVHQTPLIFSANLSHLFGAKIYLKLENLQRTGSFKIRGATYKLLQNSDRIGAQGVVAASAGNHAQGVSLAAREAGTKAYIVMPQWASITKQEATRSYGGEIILHGDSVGECLDRAKDMARSGKVLLHPFDDPEIIAGQGTIGLEIVNALPKVDLVVGPVGGGGLMAGIATAVKALRPSAKLIGVQAENCPSAREALRRGTPIEVNATSSLADGINVKRMGALPFKILHRLMDDCVLVDENQIIAAILMLIERKKILAEGAGAVALGALMSGRLGPLSANTHVVIIVSGGNLDSPLLDRIIHRGLLENGRIMHFGVVLDDQPGALAELLNLIAGLKANVLHIHHERNDRDLPLFTTRVNLDIETRGPSHIRMISKEIEDRGYGIF